MANLTINNLPNSASISYKDKLIISKNGDSLTKTTISSLPLSSFEGNPQIIAYNEDGTTTTHLMPKKDYIQQTGQLLFQPTALTDTAARTCVAYTGTAFLTNNQDGSSNPVVITSLNGAFLTASWTGVNITMPTDGLLQVMLYLDDYENGAPSVLSGGFTINMSNAGGQITYTFSSVAFKPGWNTIQLWNPATDANYVCAKSGISYISANTGFNFAANITTFTIQLNTPATGSRVIFSGIYSQTKIKPMVMMTFDTSNADVINNFVPAWSAKGLKATLRSGGNNGFRNSTWGALMQSAYALGFDVNNGSWMRVGLNQSTTTDAFAAEVGKQQNWQLSYGLSRGAQLFSSAGNGIPKQSVYKTVLPKFGVSMMKYGGGQGYVNTFGPAGVPSPFVITAKGWAGRTAGLNDIKGLLYTGGLICYFGHQCEIAGTEPPPDSASPSSGGGMYYEDAVYFANYFKTLQDAGQLEVITASDLSKILSID